MDEELLRMAAFASEGGGGNPAGVWLGAVLPPPGQMQRIAADVGYSETAFSQRIDDRRWVTRYYSPRGEVSFCGHATIATGVGLAARLGPGSFCLETAAGDVVVEAGQGPDGAWRATLTSVEPERRPVAGDVLAAALDAFGWDPDVLDPQIPPGLAYAGAWHLVLPLASGAALATMDYAFDALRDLMVAHGLTTAQVVHRTGADQFRSRNPFPVGGVVEDPATGAAAAALGGYLRGLGLVAVPTTIEIHQGYEMGRPSHLLVEIPEQGGIRVTGSAVPIEG